MNFRLRILCAALISLTIISCKEDAASPNPPAHKTPVIIYFHPDTLYAGDTVKIYGYDFGGSADSGYVSFGDIKAYYYPFWSDSAIWTIAPMDAVSGALTVTVNGIKSADKPYVISIPTEYYEIQIGGQAWMNRNLDVDRYSNGDPIPQVTDSAAWADLDKGAWCYFKNDPILGKTYGKLYNWHAVNDPRGLAPEGWRIPSDSDWVVLENFLGAASPGGKLKTTGTIETGDGHWHSDNTGASNESGFSALPGGRRGVDGVDYFIGLRGCWWAADEFSDSLAYSRALRYNSDLFFRETNYKRSGYSVRCIKEK